MLVFLLLTPIWLPLTVAFIAIIFRLDGKLLDLTSENKGKPTISLGDIMNRYLEEKRSDKHLLKW